jgi:hypothetical protein
MRNKMTQKQILIWDTAVVMTTSCLVLTRNPGRSRHKRSSANLGHQASCQPRSKWSHMSMIEVFLSYHKRFQVGTSPPYVSLFVMA